MTQISEKKAVFSSEMDGLRREFGEIITQMVTASKSVKIALLSSDLKKLGAFFGEFQTFAFLLPILISCLNSNDSELKRTFFRNISQVCSAAGPICVKPILPCILPEIYGMKDLDFDPHAQVHPSQFRAKLFNA